MQSCFPSNFCLGSITFFNLEASPEFCPFQQPTGAVAWDAERCAVSRTSAWSVCPQVTDSFSWFQLVGSKHCCGLWRVGPSSLHVHAAKGEGSGSPGDSVSKHPASRPLPCFAPFPLASASCSGHITSHHIQPTPPCRCSVGAGIQPHGVLAAGWTLLKTKRALGWLGCHLTCCSEPCVGPSQARPCHPACRCSVDAGVQLHGVCSGVRQWSLSAHGWPHCLSHDKP